MGDNKQKEKQRIERLGEENFNSNGTLMKIIEYESSESIIVEFQDEYKVKKKCKYCQFKEGALKNPYDKTLYNIGFIGEGKYNHRNVPIIYNTWHHMLKRCYDPYYINKHMTYIDCYVERYLHNFQNFVKWYEENYYKVNCERMELDKDILEKGNKCYDRKHMVFVPKRINTLFIKNDNNRGEYPIGVSYHKQHEQLCVRCKKEHLGYFPLDRPFQAFTCYKKFKENYIKEVADEYKNLIPQKIYNAMYKWEVEIND